MLEMISFILIILEVIKSEGGGAGADERWATPLAMLRLGEGLCSEELKWLKITMFAKGKVMPRMHKPCIHSSIATQVEGTLKMCGSIQRTTFSFW